VRRLRALLAAALLTVALVACASGAPTANAPTASAPAAPSMEAQRDPPSGMPPPVIAEDCRSLMGIIPVSPADPDPYANTWAFALRHALAVGHAEDVASVGIRVDQVVVHPVAGDVDGTRRIVEAAIDDLGSAGFAVGEWQMGDARAWTFTELCSAFDELRAAMGGGPVVGLWPMDDGSMEVEVRDEAAMSSPILTELELRHPGMLLVTVRVGEVVGEAPSG